jgi:hypothetical protein
MFRPDNPKHPGFEGLNQDILPIFRIERFIQINGFSIRRKQVPMCPAFCLTDYKVQSKTLSKVIVDLKDDGDTRGQDAHRKFCSRYQSYSTIGRELPLTILVGALDRGVDWVNKIGSGQRAKPN